MKFQCLHSFNVSLEKDSNPESFSHILPSTLGCEREMMAIDSIFPLIENIWNRLQTKKLRVSNISSSFVPFLCNRCRRSVIIVILGCPKCIWWLEFHFLPVSIGWQRKKNLSATIFSSHSYTEEWNSESRNNCLHLMKLSERITRGMEKKLMRLLLKFTAVVKVKKSVGKLWNIGFGLYELPEISCIKSQMSRYSANFT